VGVAALAAGGLLVAACGGGGSGQLASATPSPVTIAVGSSPLGQIVVDATGHALYRFDKDMPGSGASACNGACAAAWPAAVITGPPTAGPGLAGALGVITRSDGTHQISLDGHPLYRYAGDQAPGDTTGDGIGGIWHVIRASSPVAAKSPPPPARNGY